MANEADEAQVYEELHLAHAIAKHKSNTAYVHPQKQYDLCQDCDYQISSERQLEQPGTMFCKECARYREEERKAAIRNEGNRQ